MDMESEWFVIINQESWNLFDHIDEGKPHLNPSRMFLTGTYFKHFDLNAKSL